MEEMFDNILDECIDRTGHGESIEDCLSDYPEHAEKLRPLLEAVMSTRNACTFRPRASARLEARQRFNAALNRKEKHHKNEWIPFPWIFNRARGWAIAATIIVVALFGYLGITQLNSDVNSPTVITVESNDEGNFTFLISDAKNAIGDFQSLDIGVSRISLLQQDGDWVEFTPETGIVDLTLLQGELAQPVWRGNIPQGEYTAAVLYVNHTGGVLNDTGKAADIRLPGNKLHLDLDFNVSSNEETEFVYDVTVISSGNGGYNLLPFPDESGTGQTIRKVNTGEQGQGQDNGQHGEQANGQGQGPGGG